MLTNGSQQGLGLGVQNVLDASECIIVEDPSYLAALGSFIFMMRTLKQYPFTSDQVFLIWWLMTVVLGVGFLPLTQVLFDAFTDKGWLFSKAIGIAVAGFLVWAGVCAGFLKFNTTICIAVTVAAIHSVGLLPEMQGEDQHSSG